MVADSTLEQKKLEAKRLYAKKLYEQRQSTPQQTGNTAENIRAVDTPLSTAAMFTQGMAESLADIPINIYNAINYINPLTGDEGRINPETNPLRPSTQIGRVEPRTATERVAAEAGEFGGEALALGAGAAATLPKYGLTAVQRARALTSGKTAPLIVDDIVNFIKANPKKFLAGETALGSVSGGAMQSAEEAGAGQVGQLAAGILAPMSAGTLASGAKIAGSTYLKYSPMKAVFDRTTGTGKAIVNQIYGRDVFKDDMGKEVAQLTVDKLLASEMSEQSLRNAVKGQEIEERMGLDLTLSQKAKSEGLKAEESKIVKKMSGSEIEAYNERLARNRNAIYDYASDAAPDGPEITYMIDEAGKYIDRIQGTISTKLDDISSEMTKITPGDVDRVAEGKKLRERYDFFRNLKRAELNQQASQLGINSLKASDPYINLGANIKNLIDAPRGRLADKPDVPEGLKKVVREYKTYIDALEAGGSPPKPSATFQDLKGLREDLSKKITEALSGSKQEAFDAKQMIEAKAFIDEALDNFAPNNRMYNEFRQKYFDEFIKPFDESAGYKVRQSNGRGFYNTYDEKVADLFFSSGSVSDARKFKEIFGNDAEANQALYRVVADKISEASVKDGVFDQKKLKLWIEKHRSVLNEFPDLRQLVQNTQKTNQVLLNRQEQLHARMKRVQDASLTKLLKDKNKAPLEVINDAFRDKKTLNQLVNRVKKEPAAMQAMQRAVWTYANDMEPTSLRAFMSRNNDVLTDIFDESHIKNLEDIIDAYEINGFTPMAGASAPKENPLEGVEGALGGIPVQTLTTRVRDLYLRRVDSGYVFADIFARAFKGYSQQKKDAILKEALFNKDFATELKKMNKETIKEPEKRLQKLNAYLFNIGVQPITGDQE